MIFIFKIKDWFMSNYGYLINYDDNNIEDFVYEISGTTTVPYFISYSGSGVTVRVIDDDDDINEVVDEFDE